MQVSIFSDFFYIRTAEIKKLLFLMLGILKVSSYETPFCLT